MIKWYKNLSKFGKSEFQAAVANILGFIFILLILPMFPWLAGILVFLWWLIFMLSYRVVRKTNNYDVDKGN